MIELTHEAIDVARVERAVHSPDCGGVVVFVGRVRDRSEGRAVRGMEYEAYEDMALARMRAIAAEVREQWATGPVAIVHRLGALDIGEASVAIAVAAPHRAAAFEACRAVIDRLKEDVPIWKKEFWADGEGWIEGRESRV